VIDLERIRRICANARAAQALVDAGMPEPELLGLTPIAA
jgi:hypothetical protein